MAYFSLHAYDADVWVPEFLGLNQSDDGMNQDVRFAAEQANVETVGGALQPRAAYREIEGGFEGQRIETLAMIHRRWYAGNGSKNWFVAAVNGKLYYKQMGEATPWTQIEMPSGVTSFESNVWSWITYEQTVQGEGDVPITVDVLILSNAVDGMFMVIPPEAPYKWEYFSQHTWSEYDTEYTWGSVLTDHWTTIKIGSDNYGLEYNFGIIERSNDRLWGCAVPGEPDLLMYSAVYDPTDWDVNTSREFPEQGPGQNLLPSWDGAQFTALKQFGDQLLAFKQNRVWRVLGVYPGEYEFKEQFGGGTKYPNTIAVGIEQVFMIGDDGPLVYDGMSVSPWRQEQIKRIWQSVNRDAMDQMCAALYNQRYYLAFPTGDSTVNNALLIFNLADNTILYHTDIYIESFLSTIYGLYATSSSIPGKMIEIRYDSWEEGAVCGAATEWITPWMDFGYKRIQKGGFDLYFAPEIQGDQPVTLSFSIQTEKKVKTKQYIVQPLTEAQKAANRQYRYKRMHFGGMGRKFRVIIRTAEGVTIPWRLVGGLHLVVETDPD